jgi:hypothetical protein
MGGKGSSVSSLMMFIFYGPSHVSRYCTERTAQEMFNSSDDIISQYIGAFQQLKERFGLRSGLATLKVLHNVTQGVLQFSETLDDLKDMGSVSCHDRVPGITTNVRHAL